MFFKVIHQSLGPTARKIDYLDLVRTRLLGRPQLSNPSDLPCPFRHYFVRSRTDECISCQGGPVGSLASDVLAGLLVVDMAQEILA